MKTAILIVGHIRTWSECKTNFIQSFQHLNPDVFVSTYDVQYNYAEAQRRWMGGLPDIILSKNQIQNLFAHVNLIDLEVESLYECISGYESVRKNLHANFQNEADTYLQYTKIIKGLKLIEDAEHKKKSKYDCIIRIRTDIVYDKFDYIIDEKNVIISEGNVYPNDVIIATSRNNFLKIGNFFELEFYNQRFSDSHKKPPHNLLLRSFEYANLSIEQKNLMKYVMRRIGKQYYDTNGSIN